MPKSADAYRTISEAAEELKVPQHVLRFWETRFPQIRPLKRGGNRRFYRPDDVELLSAIKRLLYQDGFTIKGVQRILNDRGPRAVAGLAAAAQAGAAPTTDPADGSPSEATEGDEPREPDLDDPVLSDDMLDRLQAVLFEVSECRRILSAVRD